MKHLINHEDKPVDLQGYRFAASPFFKLCKKVQTPPDTTSLVLGMYIQLDQWELLLSDNSTAGPYGNSQLGHHTLNKRYLTRETFVGLVRSGLIGTEGCASRKIGLFTAAVISMGHSVIYAIETKGPGSKQS